MKRTRSNRAGGRAGYGTAWLAGCCALAWAAAGPDAAGPGAGPAPASSRVNIEQGIPDWLARWELAKVLSHAKRYDEAIAEYRKLLAEKPDLAEAKAEMAHVLFWSGQPDKALEVLNELPPGASDGQTAVLMADLYVARQEFDKAEPLYREYLKTHPADQVVRLKLAEVMSWRKKYEDSLREYETLLKERPDDVQLRRKYAIVLNWAGRRDEAIEQLKRTLE